MIKLYREEKSKQADTIEAEFRDLVLGYDLVVIDPQEAQQKFGDGVSLPVLTNNEHVVSGEQIPGYLKELQKFMHDWQLFQGDSCYVDDNGESC